MQGLLTSFLASEEKDLLSRSLNETDTNVVAFLCKYPCKNMPSPQYRFRKYAASIGVRSFLLSVCLSLIGETLGLVPVSRLNCPRLLVSSRFRVKNSTWSCLGLVSLCLKGPVSSRLSVAFIFEVKSRPGLVSVARNWSRHLKKIKYYNLQVKYLLYTL